MNQITVYSEETSELTTGSVISTPSELAQCNGHTIALDTETTGLHPWNNRLIGVGFFCPQAGVEGYIPTHDSDTKSLVLDIVNSFSSDTVFIFHNAKFDMHFMKMKPKRNKMHLMDTAIMVHLIDSRNRKSLKDAEAKFLGTNSKRQHVAAAPARKPIWEWPEEIRASYCVNDCRVTYQLAQTLYPILEEMKLDDLFWKDMDFTTTLYETEDYGVLMDEGFVYRSADKLQEHLDIMEQDLMDRCGRTFNWRSPKQLSEAIYGGLGIPKPKNPFAGADGIDHSRFADSGKYKSFCTSTFLLTEKVHHPLGELISSMRECDKLRKAYLKWLELQDSDHILHTSFNQTGTRTGRLSSSRPNLQNIASKTRGRFTQSVYTGSVERTDEFNMRKAIIARPDCMFISVDYKQMEMRMFGILSKDPFMLEALLSGKDVHLEIALKVWGDCGESMNKVHREWSKTITFGLIYGMTLGSLQFKLDMTRPQAAKITEDYWKEFPRIKPWMNEVIDMGIRDGFLRYWSGRLWREEDPIDMYKGCNALIQGGCFDLLSIASMRVDKFNDATSGNRLVNFVHDETITEAPIKDVMYSVRNISEIMQVPDLMGIPFATDVKVGPSYGVMAKIGKEVYLNEGIHDFILSDYMKDEDGKADEKVEETDILEGEFKDVDGDEDEEEGMI